MTEHESDLFDWFEVGGRPPVLPPELRALPPPPEAEETPDPEPQLTLRKLFTLAEAARAAGVTASTVSRWIRQGKLKAVTVSEKVERTVTYTSVRTEYVRKVAADDVTRLAPKPKQQRRAA
jgi:excisionase family DNA binding protein